MWNRDRRSSMCDDVQKVIKCDVVNLVSRTALNAEDHEAEIRWRDAGVVQTVSNGSRRPGAVNTMTLETCKPFLLDRDDNLVAAQQTRRAVVRRADPQNPRLIVHR